MNARRTDMIKKRPLKLKEVLAFISVSCIVVTIAALVAGETLFPDYEWRFWIIGLGVLGSIVGTHLFMSVRFTDRNEVRSSVIYLGVLSVATSVAWFIIDYVVSLPMAFLFMSSRPSQNALDVGAILNGTVFLPFQLSAWLGAVALPQPVEVGYALICGFVVTVGCLFLLSLLATGLILSRKVYFTE